MLVALAKKFPYLILQLEELPPNFFPNQITVEPLLSLLALQLQVVLPSPPVPALKQPDQKKGTRLPLILNQRHIYGKKIVVVCHFS